MDEKRLTARAVAQEYLTKGDPLGWFEALYAKADKNEAVIPWADLVANPNLLDWVGKQTSNLFQGKRILVAGCGLGDDCAWFLEQGAEVTGFDISSTAIEWCKRRFSLPALNFVEANLLNPRSDWRGSFDWVFEAYTLQVLPSSLRKDALYHLCSFMKPNGHMLLIARGRDISEPEGNMPWPLTKEELFPPKGIELVDPVEDFYDGEEMPVRRFRALYRAV